ncbi:MAG: DNA/RNA non-specific endonuclease [Bacteroidota bacterium]
MKLYTHLKTFLILGVSVFLTSCDAWLFPEPNFENDLLADHLELGNPSRAANESDNYLLYKTQFALSYNNEKAIPNWVSWHLSNAWLGMTDRQDDFRSDSDLPNFLYKVSGSDYRGSGFDRGHLCPSADRTLTPADNSSTFVMTNMIPQSPDNNRGPWADLENYCRHLIEGGNLELYILAGTYGLGGEGASGSEESIDENRIAVPQQTWKIIVVLPQGTNDLARVNPNTRVIAVDMPNRQGIRDQEWRDFRTTVDDLEEKTGLDFLSNVAPSVQRLIEARLDQG